MATLYRDTGYSLTHLIEDIKHGNLALPDIQRPFVWRQAKIRELFDSMYRGYPVGTLMFWETGARAGTKQVGGGESDEVAKLLIVDGQQRLTSLYAVLTGSPVINKDFEKKNIRIAFRPSDESFEVADVAIERDPNFVPDITQLWAGSYKSTVRRFMARLSEARDEDVPHWEQDLLEERIDRVRDLRDFRFQVIELNATAGEEQVAEIFVRINSEGVQLNQADFILTLMSVHWEQGRSQLEAFCRDSVDPSVRGASPRNSFIDPSPDKLLRAAVGVAFRRGRLSHVYSLLRGKDLETGEVSEVLRVKQFEALRDAQNAVVNLTNWHEYLKCLQVAGFRSRKMIISENALIYTYALWLIGIRDFGMSVSEIRPVIARWFFMVQTTGRYTSSPESAIEADFGRLSQLDRADGTSFGKELDRIVSANFTRDYWEISLPNRLDTSAARSPVLFAYWAALSLLDAELLFSKARVRDLLDPAVTAPRSIERHHLFPKAYLATKGVTATARVNAIGNMAFLDWGENGKIGSRAPQDYWHEFTASMAPERLRQQAYWHALPIGWEQLEYAEFLERRRGLISKVVYDGFATLWEDTGQAQSPSSLGDLIRLGETQTMEFKSTARWNLHTQQADKKMEQVIVKTVGGFANAEGGTLLIGVDDDGNAVGLGHDYSTLGSKGNRDGFELFVRNLLDQSLSISTAGLIRSRFEQVSGQDVCVLTVAPAGKPVFAKADGSSGHNAFFVRIGNATKQLHGEDLIQYRDDHWG